MTAAISQENRLPPKWINNTLEIQIELKDLYSAWICRSGSVDFVSGFGVLPAFNPNVDTFGSHAGERVAKEKA